MDTLFLVGKIYSNLNAPDRCIFTYTSLGYKIILLECLCNLVYYLHMGVITPVLQNRLRLTPPTLEPLCAALPAPVVAPLAPPITLLCPKLPPEARTIRPISSATMQNQRDVVVVAVNMCSKTRISSLC